MSIAVLPIFLTYILITFILIRNKLSFRTSIIFSFTILSLLITIITELLGFLNILEFKFLLVNWLLILTGLTIYSIYIFKKDNITFNPSRWVKELIHTIKIKFNKLDTISRVLFVIITSIIIILGFIASYAYPNNYDAMTYHLPRIMHWLQNHNLNHYATHILRQLYSNPFSEYMILNLMTLGKTDLLANFAQYFSMIGSIIGITSITKYLGGSTKVQIYSAFIALTIPVGLIQAPNTQNDYVVTFFIVSFILSSLILIKNDLTKYQNIFYIVICSISLGLAILTKGTAYFFLFPFGITLIILYISKYKYKSLLLLLTFIIIPLSINAPHYLRNYDTFNDFLGPKKEIEELFTVKNHNLNGFISNIIRNIGLHIQIPNEDIQNSIQTEIYNIHKYINYKINDLDTTIGSYYNHPKFELKKVQTNDHYTANTLHLLLIFISLCMFIKPSFRKDNKKYFLYSILLLSSFLLFCFLVKWQPFGSRLHLPLFVLFSPLIAILLSQIEKAKMKLLLTLILTIVVINALPYIFSSQIRPFTGQYSIFTRSKYQQYYANMEYLQNHQLHGYETLFFLNKKNIGLILWKDQYEYPIWAKLKETGENFTIRHAKVKNISSQYENKNFDVIRDFSDL